MRFWDSSALVPLVVQQARSLEAIRWTGEDPSILAWTLTPTEMLAAIHRLVREGTLTAQAAATAERSTVDLMARSQLLANVEVVKEHAARAIRIHPLRAGDALQLGAALSWVSGRPERQVFHTLDRRLAQAAALEGFRVIPDA